MDHTRCMTKLVFENSIHFIILKFNSPVLFNQQGNILPYNRSGSTRSVLENIAPADRAKRIVSSFNNALPGRVIL